MVGHDILLIYEQDLKRAADIIRDLLIGSQVSCALLISRRDGSLIWQQGETGGLDTTSLAALAAACFSATEEIARLIGEPEFSVLFHQGKREHIYVSSIGEEALLMLLFDDRTTLGLVRVLTKDASNRLAQILSASSHPPSV